MIGNTPITGYVGGDAQILYTKQETPYSQFSLGVTESYSTDEGRKSKTTWFQCTIWGKRGEGINKYILKGMHLCLVGRIDAYAYKHKESGEAVSQLTFRVADGRDTLEFLDKRADDQAVIDAEAAAIAAETEAEFQAGLAPASFQ